MKKIILSILFLFFVSNAVLADSSSTEVKDNNKKLSVSVISTGASSFIKINYEPYINKLAHLIFANWDYNEPADNSFTTILLNIVPNKSFDYYSSDNRQYGTQKFVESTIDAVKKVGVYNEPFPTNYTHNSMQLQLIFSALNVVNEDYDNVDFGSYMQDLQNKIYSKWHPPRLSESNRTVLLLKIAKDGKLLAASIFQSSGLKDCDDAALEAVYDASPFKPLPEGFKGKSIDIQFTFDYGVYHPLKPVVNWQNASVSNYITYIIELDKTLYVVNKNLMRYENGFNYINALKITPFTSNAYLLRCKIDCKNRQIGVKRSYEGNVSAQYALPRYVKIFTDKVKMTKPESNQDYLKIYNFVCEP